MPQSDDDPSDKEPQSERPSHCPKCDALPRLMVRMFDPKQQRHVDLYRCPECDALIWVD